MNAASYMPRGVVYVWEPIIGGAGVGVAVVSAAIAWTQNRKAAAAAADAVAAQRQAAEAAAQSAESAAQSAEAHTALARHADVAAQRPPWKLRHTAGDKYELVNDGPTDRFAVRVDGESIELAPNRTPPMMDRLTAGSSLRFMAARAMDTDSAITASWRDAPGEDERSWTQELPAKPRKRGT